MLLKHTAVGSSIREVEEFISRQLQRSGEVLVVAVQPAQVASRRTAAKTIRVNLGEYYEHLGAVFLTAPMIVHKEVTGQWWFNRHDRLIDISVEKHTSVY